MQSFWNWLIGEAGAGWIVGILGIIGGIYAWRKRERPPRVVLQEVNSVNLLDIHPSQAEKLEVYYTPDPERKDRMHKISRLYQSTLKRTRRMDNEHHN